ncbi:MAG: protein kinase [Anaerolineae bacterium]|nr:protein kinase [Anaerolineae bacterium]
MLETGMILQQRYHTVRKLGGGGMGTVYLSEDMRLPGRQCAVKEMIPEELPSADRQWATQAFQMEAQMLANLSHPGLTKVTDFFSEHGNWYLVMDFVPGETLEKRIAKYPGNKLPLSEALNIIHQICQVLEYLHSQNPSVIFRDLKPSNVMVTPQQQVKLIDFGIARFFKQGKSSDTANLGTPGYAAPEQYGGAGQSDARTDIYSLGVLMTQLITGYDPSTAASPFPMPDPRSLMPSIPPHIAQVISRATQLQPTLRFNSVTEVKQILFNTGPNQLTQPQSGYGPSQAGPTSTQVMPGQASQPVWPENQNAFTSHYQNTAQYQTPPGRGYTQIQNPGGAPPSVAYPPSGTSTPWPSEPGGMTAYPQAVKAPPAKPKIGLIFAILGIGIIGIGLCASAFLFGQDLFEMLFPTPPVIVVETPIDDENTIVEPVVDPTDTPTLELTEEITVEPTEEPSVNPDDSPTDTPTPSPTMTEEPPPPMVTVSNGALGNSVQGRELSYTKIGYENAPTAVVVIGSIQGDQVTTRNLVTALINHYVQNPDQVPLDTQLTLIPSINPDGNVLGSRFNAHEVDLNRNWAASDWVSNAAVPGYPEGKAGSGGLQPFSEPETRLLRDYINNLKSNTTLRVFVLHSSVRLSSGEIYPGGNSAIELATAYANATGYAIENAWAAYVTSGEAVTWCEEQGVLAIDVVIPATQNPGSLVSGNRTLLSITVDGLRSIAEYR